MGSPARCALGLSPGSPELGGAAPKGAPGPTDPGLAPRPAPSSPAALPVPTPTVTSWATPGGQRVSCFLHFLVGKMGTIQGCFPNSQISKKGQQSVCAGVYTSQSENVLQSYVMKRRDPGTNTYRWDRSQPVGVCGQPVPTGCWDCLLGARLVPSTHGARATKGEPCLSPHTRASPPWARSPDGRAKP